MGILNKVGFVATLISSGGLAREKLAIKESVGDLMHRRPQVEELNCRNCFVQNENSELCITYGGAWQMGWEYDQEWYDDPDTVGVKDGQYKLSWDLYSKQSFAFASLFDVERLYYNNT